MTPHKRYLRLLVCIAIPAFVAVAAFNAVVDPFFAVRGSTADAFALYKEEVKSRTAKMELLRRGENSTVLLGTSRTEVGINPESESFQGEPVFSASLEGGSFYETYKVFQYALKHAPPQRFILFADFVQFSKKRTINMDFEKSRLNAERRSVEYYLDNLLSWRATKASIDVVTRYAKGWKSPYTLSGHRWGLAEDESLAPTKAMFERIIYRYLTKPDIYAQYEYDPLRIEQLSDIVAACAERDIELYVVLSPVHAVQLEALRTAGLWEIFEQWKRDLVATVTGVAGTSVPIYDFTGYSTWTTEAVPAEGIVDGMEWFVESTHFKRELGELVLAKILDRPNAPEGFGLLLTPENTEASILEMREASLKWAESHQAEVDWVSQIAAKARSDLEG